MARTRPAPTRAAPILGVVAAFLAALPLAPPARANGPDCGGDALSHAEVVEGRRARGEAHREARPRRGPLTSLPDTLCADVADERRWRVDIQAGPPLGGGDPASQNPGQNPGQYSGQAPNRNPGSQGAPQGAGPGVPAGVPYALPRSGSRR